MEYVKSRLLYTFMFVTAHAVDPTSHEALDMHRVPAGNPYTNQLATSSTAEQASHIVYTMFSAAKDDIKDALNEIDKVIERGDPQVFHDLLAGKFEHRPGTARTLNLFLDAGPSNTPTTELIRDVDALTDHLVLAKAQISSDSTILFPAFIDALQSSIPQTAKHMRKNNCCKQISAESLVEEFGTFEGMQGNMLKEKITSLNDIFYFLPIGHPVTEMLAASLPLSQPAPAY